MSRRTPVETADAPPHPSAGRADTRAALLAAAASLFAAQGYHATSVTDIAAAAGFTKGAVYSNFASKEALFLTLVEEQVDRAVAAAEEVLDAPPAQRSDLLAERLHDAVVLGRDWFLLEAEFLLFAARNPAAGQRITARARQVHARVTDLVARHLGDLGVPEARTAAPGIARALLAVTDGLAQASAADPAVAQDASRVLADTLDALVDTARHKA